MLRTGASLAEYKNEFTADVNDVIAAYASYHSDSAASPEAEHSVRPVTESAMIAREIREGTLSAFVGGGTTVTGEVSFKSLLRIDGFLSGRITSAEGTLVVAAPGRVEATVAVAIARIGGTVTGDIVCSDRIELGPTARVTGNIQAPAIIIEHGATLDGRCRMRTPAAEPEILSEPASTTESNESQSAQPVPEAATAAADEATAVTPPKIHRKGNVVGKKRKRKQTKVATAIAADSDPASPEKAISAAG
jgi:cytoskeletal protein CcmA (bactofilin family)